MNLRLTKPTRYTLVLASLGHRLANDKIDRRFFEYNVSIASGQLAPDTIAQENIITETHYVRVFHHLPCRVKL